jgi:hypothetical protein
MFMGALPFETLPPAQPLEKRYRIAGRVVDSQGLPTSAAELTVGTEEGESSFGAFPGLFSRSRALAALVRRRTNRSR